jgi:ribulose-5-phosphate 4-epimerase/fuculose-1-phosphate aldolase
MGYVITVASRWAEERAYLKGRLAAAFRIFGKFGFDEGVAGHITLRVSTALRVSMQSKS